MTMDYRAATTPLIGFRIIEDANLVDITEDWSRVRSPGRATRRRRQGHRQNITMVSKPKTNVFVMGNRIVCHPDIARAIREKAAKA